MTRTTPRCPADAEALFPELVHHRRAATRLHPWPGNPGVRDSSVGGPLLWPAGEPWPMCTEPPKRRSGAAASGCGTSGSGGAFWPRRGAALPSPGNARGRTAAPGAGPRWRTGRRQPPRTPKPPAMSRSAAGDAWSSSPAPKTPSIPTTWSSSAPAVRGLSASREKRVPWHRSSRPGGTCRRGLFPAYVRGRRAGLMGARPMPARRSDRSGAAARALLPTTHRAGMCSGADLLAVLTPTSDSGPVSGQRKRRRRPEAERLRLTARTAPDSGRWEVIFETQDVVALRTQLRRLREARVDESMVRVDTLCGRLELPTVYRLSRFVTNPTSA